MPEQSASDTAHNASVSRCPVCNCHNQCGTAAGASHCWCFDQPVEQQLLSWLQSQNIEARCLCTSCAAGNVPSPCIGVCMVDDASGTCLGCHRTIDEITDWNRRGAASKAAVLKRIREQPEPD